MHLNFILTATAFLVSKTTGINVPANIKTFYNNVKARGDCQNKLAQGLYSYKDGPADWSYCGDHVSDYGIVYIQGKNGLFANMDIDCDGMQKAPNDGRCGTNPSDQGATAMRDYLQDYNIPGVMDLDTYRHPYVVFGNSGDQPHNVNFDPRDYGVEPLSIIFVVTPNKLVCGIWGDTNGGQYDSSYVGEAALATGELAFGEEVNGTTSHELNDVLYIAFTGQDAVPGKDEARWVAATKEEFAASIADQCLRLVSRVSNAGTGGVSSSKSNGATSTLTLTRTTPTSTTLTPIPSGGGSGTCSWAGHCIGAKCTTDSDCSDALICKSGKCNEDCTWAKHCTGAACNADSDCGDALVCKSKKCAAA